MSHLAGPDLELLSYPLLPGAELTGIPVYLVGHGGD